MSLYPFAGRLRVVPLVVILFVWLGHLGTTAEASPGSRLPHLTSFDVAVRTLTASPDQDEYVVPKNVASAVRIVVKSGDKVLTTEEVAQQLGGAFSVNAELSGPGLDRVLTLPALGPSDPPPADPLLLPLPALATAGDYKVSNIRFVRGGQAVLDVSPAEVAVKIIDQVLVTSVTTRPLTLDEILEKGIVLDGDDYLAFEFTIGMATGSESVNFSMPVIFDRQGVPVPTPVSPPADPPRLGVNIESPAPMLIPSLLTPSPEQLAEVPELALRLPDGRPIQIPSVLVIPGNVGYLKQFFSAQLFVANGAPSGSGLTLHEVTGTVKLPAGADLAPDTADDPLALPETINGTQPKTMAIRGLGFDGEPGTEDDTVRFRPGEQGQAEFLIRGEKEGFHSLEFDVEATLEGLPVGPVTVTGKARGGVLVRNPFFDMTFTIPSVVRQGETFSIFATVNNIGQGIANDVTVTLDAAALAGAVLVGSGTQQIDTLRSGDSKTLEYQFIAQRNGQVLATYLNFDTQGAGGGQLKFTLGVGERGVALSPDTLVLPSGVDELPPGVVGAAMRVLGQAWSIANAPSGTLPPEVIRISRAATTTKALALAEAGLRVKFGQTYDAALRDLAFDFYGGTTLDAGFDQLLRQTQAGYAFARALGAALGEASSAAGGALQLGKRVDHVAISGQDFVRVALGSGSSGVPAQATLFDGGNRRSDAQATPGAIPPSEIPSGFWLPLGGAGGPLLGLVPVASSALYRLELTGTGSGSTDVSVTLPRGGGTFVRGTVAGVTLASGSRARLVMDLRDPGSLLLESDLEGDGTYETSRFLATEVLQSSGPELISATVVGPETVDGASPLGFHTAVLFDRIVDPASAAVVSNYAIPKNGVQSASAQLSGRLVFASLQQPEGPYIPTTFRAAGVRDQRGQPGAATTVALSALLDAPGAVVSGRVIGPDGQPVTSGTVTYENNANWQCLGDQAVQPSGFATAQLDASGRYEFRFVRQDQCGYPWAMLTSDPRTGSLRRVTGFVRAAGEQIVLDIALLGQGTVSGFVRNLQGQAVPSAQVTVVSQTDPQVGAAAVSDGDGFYQVSGITVGVVNVSAAKGTGVGRASGSIARAGGSASVDVTLDSGAASVAGRVFSEEGTTITRVPGVTVVFETEGVPIAVTTTDQDGDYLFDGVPAGPFKVKAALNARDRDEAAGVLAAGDKLEDVDLVITIPVPGAPDPTGPGYGTVRGVVRFAGGEPAPDAIVSVGDRGLLSGADGSFELFGIAVRPNQPQTVSARTRDGLRSGSASFTLNENGQITPPVTIALSGLGSAEFTVLSATGTPVVGQVVGMLDRCLAACGCEPLTTNAQGKVTFHDLPIGGVHVRAVRSGQSFVDVADATASITQDGQTATATLRFRGSGIVSGVVKNPQGQPVLGAEVQLSSPYFSADYCNLIGGVSQSMRTDSLGRFRFQAVNLGSVSVTASQAFFPNPTTRSSTLTENGQELVFEIPLQEGESTIAGVLEGTVFLPDGVTAAGAGIEVTASGALPDVVVRTDAAGHYRFAKVFPEGSYALTITDPITGGLAKSSVYLRRAQDQTHDVRLLGRGTVLVRVVDANDSAVSNAFVRLRETGFPNRDFEGSADAANQGVVRFDNVFEGGVSTEVSDVFGRGGRASATLTGPGATLEIKVRLSITGTVSGVFLAADGTTPVPFGQVTLVSNGRILGQTTTGGSGEQLGRFRFDNVPAGPVRVEAQDPATARTGFAVGNITAQDEVEELTVRSQGLGHVEGLVLSNGAPQAGAEVAVSGAGFLATTISDADGRYRVSGVPEGQVVASANLGGGFLKGSASGTLSGDGTTLTLDVPLQDSGAVSGLVLQANGTPLAVPSNVTLSVNGSSYSTVSGGDGRFHFERLPAGFASLGVDVLGSLDQGSGSTQVPPGGTAQVTIQLNGVGSLRGVARTANGTPTAGTVVISSTGSIPYSFTLLAGANGVFSLPEVLAGPFTASLTVVTPTFPLYGTATGTVVAAQQANLEVRVQPSGSLKGRVLRTSGAPALGTEVLLRLLPNRGTLPLYAVDDGSFETTGIPLGQLELSFRDPFSSGVSKLSGLSLTESGQILDVGDIVLDESPVEAVSFEPADGSLGIAVNQPLRVTFSDVLQSASGVTVNDGTQTLATSASLSSDGLTITLNGSWTDARLITITATTAVTDIHGRHPTASKSSYFRTVDLSAPRVTSVTPANQAIEVAATTTVDVTFDEPLGVGTDLSTLIALSGPTGAWLGTTEQIATDRARFTPASPWPDNASFTVSVNGGVDAVGNRQTVAFTSVFKTHDTVPPVLAQVKPTPGSWVATARPNIEVSLADALSGVEAPSSTLTLDGTVVAPERNSSAITFVPATSLSEGVHAFSASAQDRAGNLASLLGEVRVDTLPPSAAELSGVLAGSVLAGSVAVSASAIDEGSGVDRIELIADGQLASPKLVLEAPDFTGRLATSSLSEGAHVLAARAVDRAGNAGPLGVEVPVIIDNRAITVTITAPAASTPAGASVLVKASADEPIQWMLFAAGTQSAIDDAPPFEATLSLVDQPEGALSLTATAVGLTGEQASASLTVQVDHTPPAAPNADAIFAEPPDLGLSLVHGNAGSVEPLATVRITHSGTQVSGTALADATGAFALPVAASVGDTLSVVAIDRAGNPGPAAPITVRATTSLPPVAATVTYLGTLVDRVGLGTAALAPDLAPDASFLLRFNLGAGISRQLSFVELRRSGTGSATVRSTRPADGAILGLASKDLGAPFLNETDGSVTQSLAGDISLIAFAGDGGFVQPGETYTATVVFVTGHRFVGNVKLEAPPRQEVTSATLSLHNPVLLVPAPAPGDPAWAAGSISSSTLSVFNPQLLVPLPPVADGANSTGDISSRTLSLHNPQLLVPLPPAAGGANSTGDISSRTLSLHNPQLLVPLPPVADGANSTGDISSRTLSLHNPQLLVPIPALEALTGRDVSSLTLSVFNEQLLVPPPAAAELFAPGVSSPTLSVFNDPTQPAPLALAGSPPSARLAPRTAGATTTGGNAATTLPELGIDDATVVEGEPLRFEVRLSRASTNPVEVRFTTQRGTSTPESEFRDTSGVMRFEPGETLAVVNVPTYDDTLHEVDEELALVLSDAQGAALGNEEAFGLIEDDDPPGAAPAWLFDDFEQDERSPSRWQSPPELEQGLTLTTGLVTSARFAAAGAGVMTRARVRFSAAGQRFGFIDSRRSGAEGASYYFESVADDNDVLVLQAVGTGSTLPPQVVAAGPMLEDEFVDLAIERGPWGVRFLAEGHEVGALEVSEPTALSVGFASRSEAALEADWIEVMPLLEPGVVCANTGADLLGFWPGDGGGAELAADQPAVLLEGVEVVPGKVGEAFSLDGHDDAILVPGSAQLNAADLTLNAWIYLRSPPPLGQRSTLIAKQASGEPALSGEASFALQVDDKAQPLLTLWDGTSATVVSGTTPLELGVWSYLSASRERDLVLLYVDGVESATASMSAPIAFSADTGFDLELGTFLRSGSRQVLNGLLDEVTLFNRALSSAEIEAAYRAGSAGYCRP